MTTYWLSDFCVLINSFNIIPFNNKDKNEDYNALTRLIILATILLYGTNTTNRQEILMGGLISILCTIIIYMLFTKPNFDTYLVKPGSVIKQDIIKDLKDNNLKDNNLKEREHIDKIKNIRNLTVTNTKYETGIRTNFQPTKIF
tara:strand:+ start:85 stop:516 length:432 start_codon:yes stop_codon:yes gene_type:complete